MSQPKTPKSFMPQATQKQAEENAHIHTWLTRANKTTLGAATGMAAALLPLMAQAQVVGEAVALNSISGVASAQQLANGTLQLAMSNGTTLSVAAGQFSVVNGQILLSQAAAQVVSSVAATAAAGAVGAAAGAAGVGAGAVGAAALGVGAALSGGGGGGGGGESAPSETVFTINRADALGTTIASSTLNFQGPEGTSAIQVRIGETTFSAQQDSSGGWGLSLTPGQADALAQGRQTAQVTALGADKEELGSAQFALQIDTIAPEAATVALTTDSGANAEDRLTNDASLAISAPEAGATRSFVLNDGTPSTSYSAPTADGTYTLQVIDTDSAGNRTISVFTFTLDATAPDAPSLSLITDSGASASDGITNSAALSLGPVLQGVSESFSINGRAPSDTYTAPTEDGTYTVVRTLTDEAGNSASTSLTFTLDTTAPDAPSVTLAQDTGASVSDLLTNNGSLIFGTLEQGATRAITVNGTAVDDYVAPTESGAYTVAVTDTDTAGNVGATTTFSFTLDSTAPTLTLNTVSGGSIDLIDARDGLEISGATTAEDGQTVTITFDGADYTATVAEGTFTTTIPAAAVQAIRTRDGDLTSVTISANVSDLAGNTAIPADSIVPADFSGPSITINPVLADNLLNAAEVGAAELVISGTTSNVEDGQQVDLAFNGTSFPATVTNGSWSFVVDPVSINANGTYGVTANVSNQAGLAATPANITLTVDVDAPDTPRIFLAQDTGASNADRLTNDASLTFSPLAQGDSRTITVNGTEVASYTPPTTSGDYTVTVVDTDAAGNTSQVGSLAFTLDVDAPSIALGAVAEVPAGSPQVLNIDARDGGITISGTTTTEDGQTVRVELQNSSGEAVAQGQDTAGGGAFSVSIPSTSLSGLSDSETYTLVAITTDQAGNESSSAPVALAADFTAPVITVNPLSVGDTLDAIERGTSLVVTGTVSGAEDGQPFTIDLGGQQAGGTVSGSTWTATLQSNQLALLADNSTLSLIAETRDAAGNLGASTPVPLATDFAPVLQLNPIGNNNVFELESAQNGFFTISGQAFGLAPGSDVALAINGTQAATTTVQNGGFIFSVPGAAFSDVAGDSDVTFAVTAQGAAAVTETVYAAPTVDYLLVEVARSDTTVTMGIVASPDKNLANGVALSVDVSFDPSVVSYQSATGASGVFVIPNADNATAGTVTLGAVAVSAPTNPAAPLVTFDLAITNAATPIEFTMDIDGGARTYSVLGTDAADTIGTSLPNAFGLIIPGGGDDTIDLSNAGPKGIVFEPTASANGHDTIIGYLDGTNNANGDGIVFDISDTSGLRGAGNGVETLAEGGTLGTNTGLLVFTTQLADLTATTLATAANGLQGEAANDVFFMLASDGTNTALAEITFAAENDASASLMATFNGVASALDIYNNGEDVIFPNTSVLYT